MDIKSRLTELKDDKYAEFHARLIPNVARGKILGVRTPDLRKTAKELIKAGEYREFLTALPHEYNDENMLHAIVISEIDDYEECIKALEDFFPYMDNWAVTDVIKPKAFKKNKEKLLSEIQKWIASERAYEVRFALGMLMCFFQDEDFKPKYLYLAAGVKSDEYYVNMMKAWFFATALTKQWESAITFIENGSLDKWVHNKVIQKAVESLRITDDKKAYLKKLRLK